MNDQQALAVGARRPSVLAPITSRLGRHALTAIVIAVLGVLVVVPLVRLVTESVASEGTWSDILSGELSDALLRTPLRNSLLVGVLTGLASVVLGGGLAWLVVMTDVPWRRLLGVLATIPFALPSFGLALVWESVFRNDRLGSSRVGLLQSAGLDVPDVIAWGWLPIVAVMTVHYFPLVFLLVAAALSSVKSDTTEAAILTGASRTRLAIGITLPVVRPALLSGFLLAFATSVSNFAAPALLGLPVRFYTISTRIEGAIATGRGERGYALAVALIGVAGALIAVNLLLTRRAKAFQTISGKGARRSRLRLGSARLPLFGVAAVICSITTIVPAIILVLTTVSRRTGSFAAGLTGHYWFGEGDPSIAQGQAGVLRNPVLLDALATTLKLGGTVALISTVVGLSIGYVSSRQRGPVATTVSALSFVPFLIPGLALGAALALTFAQPIGPLPSLTGTFTLLVVGGVAITLPYSARAGASAMAQIGSELEEAAIIAGSGFWQRLTRILMPLVVRGLVAGALLTFVKIIRDISMIILLASPTTLVLTVIAYRYASDGFTQLANATLVIVTVLSVVATVIADRLEGSSQPWNEETA